MITAKDVFLSAMHLMDEESQDGTFVGYSDDLKKKSWSVLTILQSELIPPDMVPTVIVDEKSTFLLSDQTCLAALPYGLAAHLIMDDDQGRAAYYNARYDELKRIYPTIQTSIEEVYSVEPIDLTGGVM